jgi:hypothetical protein
MKVYEPLNSLDKIDYPGWDTEADLQANLYAKLLADGFVVKAGLPYRANLGTGGCTLDLVIFKGRKAVAVLELKNIIIGPTTDLASSHQGLKYRQFGIPVVLFWDMDNYPELKKFLADEKFQQQENRFKNPKDPFVLKRLHRSLDIASMAAYDLGMHELEAELEKQRDRITDKIREQI